MLVLRFLPRNQGHAGEKRGRPVADVEKALLPFRVIAVGRPRPGGRLRNEIGDVPSGLADQSVVGGAMHSGKPARR